MRLVEIIKSFGKFRRKRSTEKEVDKLADYQRNTSEAEDGGRGHENPALDVTITDSSSSAESSRSGSLDFSAVQLEQSTVDHLNHLEEEEDADDDRSSVSSSSVEDGTASTTTDPQTSSPSSPSSSFVVRSRLLVSAWRRLKRVRAVGILCALASVLFWSFNGLLIKLNDGYFGVHVLESLTISSFIVCLVYLTFIFSVYGRRPANGGCGGLSSTSSVTSFASSTLSTSSSKKDIFVGGVSKGGHHHPHNHHLSTMTIDWRVILGVPGERWSLFLRCFLGTISLATFYTSYTYIPLSDATTIRFTSPVFIAAFAHFLVAEPFGLLQVVNSCTTLAGVVLIGRPSFLFGGPSGGGDNSTFFDSNSTTITTTSPTFFHFYAQFGGGGGSSEEGGGGVQGGSSSNFNGRTHTAIGLALALISAVSISVSMIAMRRMKRTPAALVIFWFSACNVLLGLLGLAALGKWSVPPGVTSWAIIGSTTLCNGFDQLFVTLALKLENAGAVAVIQALCVVLSFLFSIAILQETLYWTSALGGAFIFLSVLMLGFAKMASEMAKSADDKKKVPPKSDSNKGGGGGRWRRQIFQLNLSTAAAKLKQSKSFDIISSSSSSHQQQKVGHLSSLGAFSNPTLSSTDSLSPNFTFAIAPPVYPLYQNTITSTSPSSATTESGLYGVGSEPYLLRVAPINGCEGLHRGLRPEQHNNNSIDGNNNVG